MKALVYNIGMSNIKTQFKKGQTAWNKGLKGYLAGDKSPFWKNALVDVKCKKCGLIFKNFPSNHRVFCSMECKNNWWKGKPRKNAGKPNPKVAGANNYQWKGGKRECINCGKKVRSFKTKRCRACSSSFYVGDKASNWNGGITSERLKIYNSDKYKNWRNACFKRDNYTCKKYGTKTKIVVHHIKNFAKYPELRFDINNGITLSDKAHKEFHKIYGNRNNNKKQLLIFLNK